MRARHHRMALKAKRAIDMAGSVAGLVVLSPLLAGIGIAVAVAHGRPVLFRQTRPGLGGRPFEIIKFRTMRPLRPGEDPYRSDAERVTRLGKFLRDSSLDELPELWNVLRGEMSLVGPRPLVMEYLDHYTPDEARRHDVLPGITGWAAVNGRHELEFRERLKLDTWYVDHWSLGLDFKILAMTVYQVLRREHVETVEGTEGFPVPPAASSDQGADPAAPSRPDPDGR